MIRRDIFAMPMPPIIRESSLMMIMMSHVYFAAAADTPSLVFTLPPHNITHEYQHDYYAIDWWHTMITPPIFLSFFFSLYMTNNNNICFRRFFSIFFSSFHNTHYHTHINIYTLLLRLDYFHWDMEILIYIIIALPLLFITITIEYETWRYADDAACRWAFRHISLMP